MSDAGPRPGRGALPRRVALHRLLVPLAILALAGCATIPTSGPVRSGGDLQLQRAEEDVSTIAQPPAKGASPTTIVIGFLQSGADFVNDHEIARAYLTPTARQRWRPQAGTVIYDRAASALAVRPTATGDEVSVDGAEIGRIDAEGGFARSRPGGTVTRDFGLQKVDGEWRINTLEDGLLLSLANVGETYRQFTLYFLAPSGGTLVPDSVLLPVLPGLTTKLVGRLLRGPTARMRQAVGTAFPPGTDLEVGSVPVTNGLATVRLDSTAREAGDDAREQMSAQIVWTLKQLPEVLRVRVTAGGENLAVSGVAEELDRDSWPTYDPDLLPDSPTAYVVTDGRVGRYLNRKFEPAPGAAGSGDVHLRTPAVSLDGTRVAAVAADGATVLVGPLSRDGRLEPRVTGTDLAQPSWDPGNNLWVVDRGDGQLWYLADGADTAQKIAVRPLAGARRPSAVAVAHDGARIAMIVGSGRGARLRVLAVRRAETADPTVAGGEEVSVVEPRNPLPDLRAVADVSWADASWLVVLGSRAGGPVGPSYLTTDGYEVRDVEPVPDPVALTAASPPGQPQENPLVVGTADGQLLQFTSGRGWLLVGEGSDPAYPG